MTPTFTFYYYEQTALWEVVGLLSHAYNCLLQVASINALVTLVWSWVRKLLLWRPLVTIGLETDVMDSGGEALLKTRLCAGSGRL